MSVNFDFPRSFVSSHLKNEYDDVLRRNNTFSNELVTDLIDLSSPGIYRTHMTMSNNELVTFDLETKLITEKLDHWYLDMKKNLINEFDRLRLQFLEDAQQNILHEKEIQAKEYIRLNEDIKIMREMLIHYEHIVDQKDQTEKNLHKALDLLYNKTIVYHHYYEWRIIYSKIIQEKYILLLTKRFYEEKLKRKTLTTWKHLIEREWKKRFELACQKKSKTILYELSNRYEIKYKQLELQILNANEEIARLKIDKNLHDEPLKKAFMRGICALNMEAMSVLFKDEHELDTTTNEKQQREYCKQRNNDNTNEQLLDQDVTLTGSSTISDEENDLKYSSYHHTRPAHVHKEYLSNTIYSTGEGHSIHVCYHYT
ncbi:unnamed protein product [Rotaria sp. Silwood2]|nr:unnamed protein product [Rotaria sp. Silwood2]